MTITFNCVNEKSNCKVYKTVYAHFDYVLDAVNHNFPNLERFELSVNFNSRMRSTAGRAFLTQDRIDLNVRLLKAHPEEILDTFIHELAHILAYKIYGPRLGNGHGKYWQHVMRKLGQEPKRTHNMNTAALKSRRRKFDVVCGCEGKVMQIGIRRLTKMMQGKANYRCVECKERIQAKDQLQISLELLGINSDFLKEG